MTALPADSTGQLANLQSPTAQTADLERQAMAAVELSRHPERPRARTVIARILENFVELRGDRVHGDDRAVIGGTARLGGRPIVVIAQEKGVDAASRAIHNFGMPHPEGYRKAVRLMRLAERFRLPLVCLVDTPAAHPGIGAEERGQGWAIATCIQTMLAVRVPTLAAILSEGGSGGALALAVADRVLAFENAVYAVAPPETAAAILYRDAGQRARAAAAQRPWVQTAFDHGMVDELVPEPGPGAHAHPEAAVAALHGAMLRIMAGLCATGVDELLARRWTRWVSIGG